MAVAYMKYVARRLIAFFSSRLFWYIVLGLFILQALWFVFSAVYPMPFDEDFHLGVIRVYAQHWSPFLTSQPIGADQFGALARDPSYLFHYLMSFPYRFIQLFGSNEMVQVVFLRCINVGLFVCGLALFRRLLLRARLSVAMTQVTLALFTLIPIVPQLAAHINYDNLLMILLPALCLMAARLVEGFRIRQVDGLALLSFIALGLYMSVVKYAALPFVIAAALFVLIGVIVCFRGAARQLWPAVVSGVQAIRRPLRIALLGVSIIGAGLFAQRYIVNIVTYHTPVPNCGQVLTAEQCINYGPWGRDYYLAQALPPDFDADPITYMGKWLRGMWYRLFFAVSGPSNEYANFPPLFIPGKIAIVVGTSGLFAVFVYWRKLFVDNIYLMLFAGLALLYVVMLWFDQFGMYRQTGQPVAINGRYLLPILPLIAAIAGVAFSIALMRFAEPLRLRIKVIAASCVLLLFLHGGGVLTFILRSEDNWYWPNQSVRAVNHTAQKVLSPIIIEGSREELNIP